MLDGDHAHRLIEALLQKGILPNLLDTCPPFQIDGNFGYVAGVSEMLLQSQTRLADGRYQIDLLPALPAAWPEGRVAGLRARGGFGVDFRWANGRLGSVTIRGPAGGDCLLRYRDRSREVHLPPEGRLELGSSLEP